MDIAEAANTIARWCALRDVDGLAPNTADLFVLFGGAIIGSVDALAHAMLQGAARRYAIVGGRGHATHLLDQSVELELKSWDATRCDAPKPYVDSEAQMLSALLCQRWGLHVDFLETRSTNCGNNIAFLLDELDGWDVAPTSVVLCQDAVMQRRMDATWQRHVRDRARYANVRRINWPSYEARLGWDGHALFWESAPEGMWPIDTYLDMLAGEVMRLTNDEWGYGPRGSDFVVAVDVPVEVRDAAAVLRRVRGAGRTPDDRYANAAE